MKGKKLNKKEIALLNEQGLIADIRNKLSNPLTLITLLKEAQHDSERGRALKAYFEENKMDMITATEKSIQAILSSLNHCAQLPADDALIILKGTRHSKDVSCRKK